jgi:hypothetical protein
VNPPDTGAVDPGAGRPPFLAGKAIETTLSIFFRNLVPLFAIAIPAYLPLVAVSWKYRLQLTQTSVPDPRAFAEAFGMQIVASMISNAVAMVLLTGAAFRALEGARVRPLESVGLGFRRMSAVLITTIPVGMLVLAGYVFCLVPGFVVAMTYSVLIPVTVLEGRWGRPAMRRCRELTKGHRWMILASYCIYLVPVAVLGGSLGIFLRHSPAPHAIVTSLFALVGGALRAVLYCVVYFQLRQAREDIDLPALAAVFD